MVDSDPLLEVSAEFEAILSCVWYLQGLHLPCSTKTASTMGQRLAHIQQEQKSKKGIAVKKM